MDDSKFLRRISQLEDKLRELFFALPKPEFQVMTQEELTILRNLAQESVEHGRKDFDFDSQPLVIAASARLLKRLGRK
jgi:hypothetical protein